MPAQAPSVQTAIADTIPEREGITEDVFLRLPAVTRTTGLSRSTIYRMLARKEFPPQAKLGLRAVGWRRSDIDRWRWNRPNVVR